MSSSSEERVIKEWLKTSDLNDMGDPVGTMYLGGTPLFNEATGETTPWIDYIKAKFPNSPWNTKDVPNEHS